MQNWNDDRLDDGFREMRAANAELREEMQKGFAELRRGNERLAAELRQELKEATAELREENRQATAELREENKRASAELREEMTVLRGEMVAGFERVNWRLDRQNYTLIAALVAIIPAALSGLVG